MNEPYPVSASMRRTLAVATCAAASIDHLIVCGEPGTGREALAAAIHERRVPQPDGTADSSTEPAVGPGPFVVFDCAGSSPGGIETALFGAASAEPVGDVPFLDEASVIAGALGGMLVLRNVADMAARVQGRLERLLRDGEACMGGRGARRYIELSLRVVLLLDQTPEQSLEDGRLSPALLRRFPRPYVEVPALRHRRDDLPGLITHRLEARGGGDGTPKRLTDSAIEVLSALPWRGNVPELDSVLETLSAVDGPVIGLSDVLRHVQFTRGESSFISSGTLRQARRRFEREYVTYVLERQNGRVGEAAKVLGVEPAHLYRKLRQLSVTPPRSRDRH